MTGHQELIARVKALRDLALGDYNRATCDLVIQSLTEREKGASAADKADACAAIYEDAPGDRNKGAASALRQFARDLCAATPSPAVAAEDLEALEDRLQAIRHLTGIPLKAEAVIKELMNALRASRATGGVRVKGPGTLEYDRPDIWRMRLAAAEAGWNKAAEHVKADPLGWLMDAASGLHNYIIQEPGKPPEINGLLSAEYVLTAINTIYMAAWAFHSALSHPSPEAEGLAKAAQAVVAAYDDCTGAEPSQSVLDRAIDVDLRAATYRHSAPLKEGGE